jgi:hypothetical protein
VTDAGVMGGYNCITYHCYRIASNDQNSPAFGAIYTNFIGSKYVM